MYIIYSWYEQHGVNPRAEYNQLPSFLPHSSPPLHLSLVTNFPYPALRAFSERKRERDPTNQPTNPHPTHCTVPGHMSDTGCLLHIHTSTTKQPCLPRGNTKYLTTPLPFPLTGVRTYNYNTKI